MTSPTIIWRNAKDVRAGQLIKRDGEARMVLRTRNVSVFAGSQGDIPAVEFMTRGRAGITYFNVFEGGNVATIVD